MNKGGFLIALILDTQKSQNWADMFPPYQRSRLWGGWGVVKGVDTVKVTKIFGTKGLDLQSPDHWPQTR